MAIRSFGDEVTRMLFEERRAPEALPPDLARRARRFLVQIDAATELEQLRAVPGLRDALRCERDVVTLAVGGGWQLTFLWRDASAWVVRLSEGRADDAC